MAGTSTPRNLDLNLLTVFEAIYETGSITRGAVRLALSQSATSHALARLRDVCGDELFVRNGQGVIPTPVAQHIYPAIRRSLDGLRQSIGEARGFDPAISTRRFRIGIPHPMGPIWAMALQEIALAEAPGVVLRFDTQTLPYEQADRMRAGDLDLCVDWMPAEGPQFVNRKLFDDRLVFIARGGHPRATPGMTADALRKERFVRVHGRHGGPSDGVRVAHEAIHALDLDWALSVSEFLEVPFLVTHTELMGFITRSMVTTTADFAELQIIEGAMPDVPIPIFMIWHEPRRADKGHMWLRSLVESAVIAISTS